MIALRSVFADASYYIAILNRADQFHAVAARWQATVRREVIQVVTTEAVMWETLNGLSASPHREMIVEFFQRMRVSSRERLIGYDRVLINEAVTLYSASHDKRWGITDCYSFVVMQRNNIVAALSTDHHFEQAGFEALLRREPSA
jgi:predicted nucleic acid-binding protein